MEDALAPLREALRQPDRRTWRRHLRHRRRGGAEAPPPEARSDAVLAAAGAHDRQATPVPWWAAGAAVLAIAGGLVLLGGWLPAHERPPGIHDGEALAAVDATAATSSIAPGAGRGAEATGAPDTPAAERLWPAAPVTVSGREVRTESGRWEIGAEGDTVLVGDWDCDGLPTPAVLRPSTGVVAVFDRWADEDAPEPARTVSTTPGAVAARTTRRCGEVAIRVADGHERIVETRRAATP